MLFTKILEVYSVEIYFLVSISRNVLKKSFAEQSKIPYSRFATYDYPDLARNKLQKLEVCFVPPSCVIVKTEKIAFRTQLPRSRRLICIANRCIDMQCRRAHITQIVARGNTYLNSRTAENSIPLSTKLYSPMLYHH